ncbi:hypothetical protein RND81_06G199500 [Saponaria officinalis]|uniref:2Fe-2S ferredoxin-type domain-containing protein n=1 Tax=Saponaria officinalis TaxID=3572 RepID=A0AAW1KDQ3_SAPOF
MWVSRISSLGFQAFRLLTQGQVAIVPRNYDIRRTSAGGIQSLLWPQQKHQYFCTTAATNSSYNEDEEMQMVNVTFVEKDGTEVHAEVPVGTNMLEAAHSVDVELEGACEGSCACSTCHVIVMDMSYYNKLPDPMDEEYDMLDLAFGLTKTSRLGCQIEATPEIDGIRFALPVTRLTP